MDVEEFGVEDGSIDEEAVALEGVWDCSIGSGSHLMPLSDVLRRFRGRTVVSLPRVENFRLRSSLVE